MGFFSWLTADTEESIRNRNTPEGARTVYLLQPQGLENIREKNYDGYGEFGGVDAYVWLTEQNTPDKALKDMSTDQRRSAGISADLGDYYVDQQGRRWCHGAPPANLADKGVLPFQGVPPEFEGLLSGDYNTSQPLYDNKTPNELIESGIWAPHPMAELMQTARGEYRPLKFSFNENAVYEDLPASKRDPSQGFFEEEKKEPTLPDTISIMWGVEDVLGRVDELDGVDVSNQEARKILQTVERQHDANQGITWCTLDFAIEDFINNRDT